MGNIAHDRKEKLSIILSLLYSSRSQEYYCQEEPKKTVKHF